MSSIHQSAAVIAASALICLAAPASATDILIENVDIVDVETRQIIRSGTIAIDDGRFSYVGTDSVPPGTAADNQTLVIDGSELVALPGFVNAHTHLWQHVFRGLKTASGLDAWSPLVHQFLHYCTKQEMYDATLAAAAQSLLSGITTVADFAAQYSEFTLDATSAAIREAGLGGAVLFWNPASFLPPDIKQWEISRLQSHVGPLDLWMAQGHSFLYQPPAIYDGIEIARSRNLNLSEHTMEAVSSNRLIFGIYKTYLADYGDRLKPEDRAAIQALVDKGSASSVDRVRLITRLSRQVLENPNSVEELSAADRERLKAWADLPETMTEADALDFLGAFDLETPYLMIHGVWANGDNIATMARKGVNVTTQPDSNMRLSSGIAPLWQYAKAGVRVAIGTDGAASNDGVSMIGAMKAAWNLQKIEQLDAAETDSVFDAWFLLRAATLEGAKALGMADRIGSITLGKEADLVLLTKDRLGLSPIIHTEGIDNLAPMIIYSANQDTVDTVISDGVVRVRGGNLQPPFDEAALSANLTRIANDVMRRQKQGKTWRETYDLGRYPAGTPWFRYRSVRKRDTIDLTLTNSGAEARTITLGFAGGTEGGAVAPMLSADTLARFPLDPPKTYLSRNVVVQPGVTVRLEKPAGGYAYSIDADGQVTTREGTDEQILLLLR